MKFKKYAVLGSVIATISLTSVALSSANDKVTTVDGKSVIESYNNLMDNDGIEHIITTEQDGVTVDIYRDIVNGRERVDYYDENGLLVNRTFTDNYGETFKIFSQYPNEQGEIDYILRELKPPKESVIENKELLQKSIIDGYFSEEFTDRMYQDWKKSNTNGDIVKYSTDNQNIYANSQTNEIIKREIVSPNGDILRTINVEIINPNKKNTDDIFKLDSHLMKENAIKDTNKARQRSLKLEIEDNTNVEYDSSNRHG